MSVVPELPNDVESLKALVARLAAERDRLAAERDRAADESRHAHDEIERLRLIIKELQRHRFGRRSERLSPDQLSLGLEDAEQQLAEAEAAAAAAPEQPPTKQDKPPRRRRANRGALPAHLPRQEIVVDVEGKTCRCCGGALHRIGEDVAERLDVIPAVLRVLVIRRPKYGCRACEAAVVQAPAPAQLIEGGLPSEALVAQVITAKYADHLPLYRQAQIWARQGIDLDRSTLADWVGRGAFELRPLYARLREQLLGAARLFADETRVPVLDPGRGRTKTGQLWTYARDDRPWGGKDPPAVAYVYEPDRTAKRPAAHLAGFEGIAQVDGYAGYEGLPRQGITLAFCWAHVRRKFYELHAAGNAPIASAALARINALYAIEAESRGQSAAARRQARQQRSRPLIEAMKPWLIARRATVSRKSTIAGAIDYALDRWDGLIRFLDDGRIELDNNTVERAMRPIALGRKNHLFAGSDGGARHWAILASLIETAKLNDIDPQAYLAWVFTRLVNGHPQQQIDALLPWNYPGTPA